MNSAELADLDAAVRKAGVKTVCEFVLRYNPMVETPHQLIQDNMFGESLYVQADYWHNPVHSGYPVLPDASAMMLGGMRDNRFYGRKLVDATDWATFPTITLNSGSVTHHPFDGEIDHFVNCIRTGVESHGNVRDGVNTHEAVFAIDESSQRGGDKIGIG